MKKLLLFGGIVLAAIFIYEYMKVKNTNAAAQNVQNTFLGAFGL